MSEDGYELFDTAHMSVTERLIACLRNETMTDVALVGDDGIPVPAARYILGSASAAFQPLLYGNSNRDGNSSTVNIRESNQKSLTALVEFCCSDELNTSIWADSHPLEIVQDTVALAKLGHTYGVPTLQMRVKEFLNPLMLAYPPLACSVFNLADSIATPDVYAASLVILQEQAYTALKCNNTNSSSSSKEGKGGNKGTVGTMTCFTPSKLEDILSDNDIDADELFLFQQLVAWRDHNDYKFTNANGICKSLVRHLDLSSIDPNAIETVVMQSGFVTAEMLVKALMAQAKSATHEGLAFASIRGPRGKKYAHVLVQGAGDAECNGVYVHVKRDKAKNSSGGTPPTGRNLLYFIKKPSTGNATPGQPIMPATNKTFVMVQDSAGIWRICDSDKSILYECRSPSNGAEDFPHTGWSAVSGELPAPECSWLRPHSNVSGSHHQGPAPRSSAEYSRTSLDFQLSDDEEPDPIFQSRSIDDTPRNEKVKPVIDYGKASASAGPKKGLLVAEEKKEAPEDLSKQNGAKHKSARITGLDGSTSDRKHAAKQNQKIRMNRKSSLVDEVTDEIDPNDPILGTTIGGDGFSPEDKKDLSEPVQTMPRNRYKLYDAAAAARETSANISSPTACMPNSSGAPVLVGCSSALKSTSGLT
ncbi:expressed unknown protein [Seminavis robusta]|uniref:BTB domain-containing protein n=1 Tax=Seminavis robusta TaxID=568900 RepID=A0A9N8E626_9STRA|nr:expressed unknown protein [Seminavis robusta]|eukprot:Sro658_g182800.1 n/a (646) ;mRNA; f:42604-44541